MNRKLQKEIERRRYLPAPGAPYDKKGAQVVGETLEAMADQGVEVTPTNLVAVATDEASPLHRYFTWDDAEAARKCRLDEARSVVNHLLVITHTETGQVAVKAQFSVRVTENAEKPAYVSFHVVQSSPDYRSQVKNAKLQELRTWCQSVKALGFEEFTPVVAAAELFGK